MRVGLLYFSLLSVITFHLKTRLRRRISHLRKAGQLRAELDHLILDQGLHAGLPEAEVPQVLEEKPSLLPPVPSASRDDSRHLTLVLRAHVLPAGSRLVQWRVGHPGRSLISLQNFYNKQWP